MGRGDRLGRPVDLVIAESIKPRLRDGILREVEYVGETPNLR